MKVIIQNLLMPTQKHQEFHYYLQVYCFDSSLIQISIFSSLRYNCFRKYHPKLFLQGFHTGVILHPPHHLKSFPYAQQHNGTCSSNLNFPLFEIRSCHCKNPHWCTQLPGCCDFKGQSCMQVLQPMACQTGLQLASFPGPSQLSITSSWVGPGNEARLQPGELTDHAAHVYYGLQQD